VDVQIEWVHSAQLGKDINLKVLDEVDGILVPGGFGKRGVEGKILAAKFARENKLPYLGLCLGLQLMVVELARHHYRGNEANSTEFNPNTKYPVIDLMPEQREIEDKGGTMRLGLYPCHLQPGTIASEVYDKEMVLERHRHRFELNNDYRDALAEAGMVFSGIYQEKDLVEIVEIKDHPFMLGTQFHPEFLSRPYRAHPLFAAFIKAVVDHSKE
jgi:CTP synthase